MNLTGKDNLTKHAWDTLGICKKGHFGSFAASDTT